MRQATTGLQRMSRVFIASVDFAPGNASRFGTTVPTEMPLGKAFSAVNEALSNVDDGEHGENKTLPFSEILATPLRYLEKGRDPTIYRPSSRHSAAFTLQRFSWELLPLKESLIFDKANEAVGSANRGAIVAAEYLEEQNFSWRLVPDSAIPLTTSLERDVTKRNQLDLIAFLIQVANSLCPEDYAVEYYVEVTTEGKEARLDNLIILRKLPSKLSKEAMQLRNADNIFGAAKNAKSIQWKNLKKELSLQDGDVLMAIEDKIKIDEGAWDLMKDEYNKPLGKPRTPDFTKEHPEVRNLGCQLLLYVHHFGSEWILLNDGNKFIAFQFEKPDIKTLSQRPLQDNPPIRANFQILDHTQVRQAMHNLLVRQMEKVLGEFKDGEWAKGGKPRGPVNFQILPTLDTPPNTSNFADSKRATEEQLTDVTDGLQQLKLGGNRDAK